MEQREFAVEAEDAGQRIDRFLAGEDTGLSRSALQNLIAEGRVLANGQPAAKNRRLKAGDTILLEIPDAAPIAAVAQDIPLDIVYEDAHLLVVNKPKGMVVHPAPGNPDGTLVNALLFHCRGSLSGIGGEIRPGIVHRIDKDTSGLLVVAKDDATHIGLSRQMAEHSDHFLSLSVFAPTDAVIHVVGAEAQTLAQRERLMQAARHVAAIGRLLLGRAFHAGDADQRGQTFDQFVRVCADIRFAVHKAPPC